MDKEIFSDAFLADIQKALTTFDELMDIFHKRKHYITFEKFNLYGKFPDYTPYKRVKRGALYVSQGSHFGIITDFGHQKIVASLKNAKLLVKAGKHEMSVNIQMVELIAILFKENSDIATYEVDLIVEPESAPKRNRDGKRNRVSKKK